jgi:N-acetylglutamate synthase-like GNAT family acetyltransferase
MIDDLIVRKANYNDLEEILSLIKSSTADNNKVMSLRDANTIYQAILDDPNYFQIVATTSTGIVGVITLVIIMQMTHEGTSSALMCDLITIENENENENLEIASDLLNYATQLAQEYGCFKTVFQCDYQTTLASSACQALGFEQSTPCFLSAGQ